MRTRYLGFQLEYPESNNISDSEKNKNERRKDQNDDKMDDHAAVIQTKLILETTTNLCTGTKEKFDEIEKKQEFVSSKESMECLEEEQHSKFITQTDEIARSGENNFIAINFIIGDKSQPIEVHLDSIFDEEEAEENFNSLEDDCNNYISAFEEASWHSASEESEIESVREEAITSNEDLLAQKSAQSFRRNHKSLENIYNNNKQINKSLTDICKTSQPIFTETMIRPKYLEMELHIYESHDDLPNAVDCKGQDNTMKTWNSLRKVESIEDDIRFHTSMGDRLNPIIDTENVLPVRSKLLYISETDDEEEIESQSLEDLDKNWKSFCTNADDRKTWRTLDAGNAQYFQNSYISAIDNRKQFHLERIKNYLRKSKSVIEQKHAKREEMRSIKDFQSKHLQKLNVRNENNHWQEDILTEEDDEDEEDIETKVAFNRTVSEILPSAKVEEERKEISGIEMNDRSEKNVKKGSRQEIVTSSEERLSVSEEHSTISDEMYVSLTESGYADEFSYIEEPNPSICISPMEEHTAESLDALVLQLVKLVGGWDEVDDFPMNLQKRDVLYSSREMLLIPQNLANNLQDDRSSDKNDSYQIVWPEELENYISAEQIEFEIEDDDADSIESGIESELNGFQWDILVTRHLQQLVHDLGEVLKTVTTTKTRTTTATKNRSAMLQEIHRIEDEQKLRSKNARRRRLLSLSPSRMPTTSLSASLPPSSATNTAGAAMKQPYIGIGAESGTRFNGSDTAAFLGGGVAGAVRICNCCPYGYHIDLDFVRYCEALANAKPSEEELQRRNRRRSRKSMEFMLGLNHLFDQWDAEERVQAVPEVAHESEPDSCSQKHRSLTSSNSFNNNRNGATYPRQRSSSVPRFTYGILPTMNTTTHNRAESPFGTASSTCSSLRGGVESDRGGETSYLSSLRQQLNIQQQQHQRTPIVSPPEQRAFLHDALDEVCSDFDRTYERTSVRSKRKESYHNHNRPLIYGGVLERRHSDRNKIDTERPALMIRHPGGEFGDIGEFDKILLELLQM